MNIRYFAQAYGTSSYGGGTYECQSTSTSPSCQTVTAPNTAVYLQPSFLIPAVLVGAVLIATAILVVKKIIRKKVNN